MRTMFARARSCGAKILIPSISGYVMTRRTVRLVNILLIFPISNAKVERGFSAMRRIKNDWRSSLGESTLDHLMRISIDGPALEQFDPRPAVNLFFCAPRRTDVQPYGSRKRRLTESETEQ